ncbi:MAG: flagellar type III secretion system pore protein FliP [Planctomycetes bacterium]|nr:flagellar type III secretion system pore protein FliP [Planctomycetota bacterium]
MNPELIANAERMGWFQDLPAPLQTALFLGALVLIPSLLVCLTGFTRIVIVLSFARRAVTSQDIPPNQVITGLALFLTLFVMAPTWEQLDAQAVTPYLKETISGPEAFEKGTTVMRGFMLRQTRRQDLALFVHMARIAPPESPEETPLRVLVPAFVISELKTAFIMGFCIYLPFLLVDLVVSSVLTSMGMVMMPPVVVSAPFKILLFVVADGWHLIAHALTASFA